MAKCKMCGSDGEFYDICTPCHDKTRNFSAACRSHDWFYYFSDDHRVYKAGQEATRKLEEKRDELGSVGERLYQAYRDIHFNPGNGFVHGWFED